MPTEKKNTAQSRFGQDWITIEKTAVEEKHKKLYIFCLCGPFTAKHVNNLLQIFDSGQGKGHPCQTYHQ